MTTYKRGDRVQVIEDDNIRVGYAKKGEIGIIDEDDSDTPWVRRSDGSLFGCLQENLKQHSPQTLDDIQVGDVIADNCLRHFPVLMRNGEIVVFGIEEDYGFSASCMWTISELKAEGFTVEQLEDLESDSIKITKVEVSKIVDDVCLWYNNNNQIPDSELNKSPEHTEMLRKMVRDSLLEVSKKIKDDIKRQLSKPEIK